MKYWLVMTLALSLAACGGDSNTNDEPADVIGGEETSGDDVLEGDDALDGEDVPEGEDGLDEDATVETSEFELLANYLENEMGDYVNTAAPHIIGAADVMAEGLENWTIIDMRTSDKYGPDDNGVWKKEANGVVDYDDGHIEGAMMAGLGEIVTFAEENLTGDEKILLACYTGHNAGHATLILNLLGYDAYSLKFGMSGWHKDFDLWTGHLGSDYVDSFVTDASPEKPESGDYPMLETGMATAEEILAARIEYLLENGPAYMNWSDLMAAPEDYFVVNYWGEEDYLGMGHFDGAIQYTPKASFGTATELATLPTDKPIAVYCYSGQTGSQMAAYLTILGYEAYDVKFGTNAVIYDNMTSHKWTAETPANFDYTGMVVASEFATLTNYLENEMGDYVNTAAPHIVGAADVMAEGLENWTIIDMRVADKYGPDENGDWAKAPNGVTDYDDGHIEGSHMLGLGEIPAWAAANLTGDEKILVACYTGHNAGHATLILNLLGYDAYSLKFGMSGWNEKFDLWTGHLGSDYVDSFVTDAAPEKPEAGDYPMLETGMETGAEILDARIEYLLEVGPAYMNWTDLMAAPEDYFVVNYWGEEDYLGMGHFDGAYQYTPKASFGTATELATLPTDMPIAVYCYSGQTGSQMAAYLTILGYEAYDVKFGTNAVIYDNMTSHKWTEAAPAGYDVVTD